MSNIQIISVEGKEWRCFHGEDGWVASCNGSGVVAEGCTWHELLESMREELEIVSENQS